MLELTDAAVLLFAFAMGYLARCVTRAAEDRPHLTHRPVPVSPTTCHARLVGATSAPFDWQKEQHP